MGIEDSEVNKLYIRLPVKRRELDEFVIRDLHPNIIKVFLPRQKSANWCIVHFENSEKLKEALPILKEKKIQNKLIKIKSCKQSNKQKKEKKPAEYSTNSLESLLNQK